MVGARRGPHAGHPRGTCVDPARRRWIGSAGALCIGSLAGGPSLAAPEPSSVDDWLARVREAASTHSFAGNYVVTGDGTASSSRISHFPQGRDSFERIEALDGEPRIVLRHNDTVHTVWPRERVTVVEQRSALDTFPSLVPASSGIRLDDYYKVASVTPGRVAGRDAQVVLVGALDDYRYSQRLWVDTQTRLLLRADTLGPQQQVLESAAFTELSIGVKAQPESVRQAMRSRSTPWRTVHADLRPTTLDAEGWKLDPPVKGFRLTSCVRRPLDPVAGDGRSPNSSALQAIYSDGLASVSVFLEDQPSPPPRDGTMQIGATYTVRTLRERHLVTVVGDVPPMSARRFAEALLRR